MPPTFLALGDSPALLPLGREVDRRSPDRHLGELPQVCESQA